jgi:allantoinase
MPIDLLIRHAHVVTPSGVHTLDLAIDGGTIVDIAAEINANSREQVDAAGLHAFPGVIDPHVHFNEPGRTEWEGFDTGSSALAAGGGTCFFDMPLNSSPPTLDGPSFDLKLQAALANSRTDFSLWGGLTPRNLDRMEELAERGVVGFKAFMSNSGIEDFERADDVTLFRGMEIAARLKLPVAVHAENDELTRSFADVARTLGRTSVRDYLSSRPIVAEVEAIRRVITFAQETGCSLHVVHVSSAWGSQEVVEGKHAYLRNLSDQRPVEVTCETCPHYLLLTDDDVESIGAPAKCAPPVRSRAEVWMLQVQLRHGGFDFVGSDHSPAPASMKTDADFFKVWGGIAGVQSTLAAMITLDLPPTDVARLTAQAAASRFRIPNKGQLAQGFDADLTLVDLSQSYTLIREMLFDRHKLSPYVGRTFRGVVKRTIVRGHVVFRDGQLIDTGFRGRLVRPER